MSGFIYKNNANSLVVGTLAAGATTLNVTASEGANFPSTFPFRLTIWDANAQGDPGEDSGMEVVHVTGRATDALTIVRAQEGTADVEHAAGEKVAMLLTAGHFNDNTYGIQAILDGWVDQNVKSGSAPALLGTNVTAIPSSNINFNILGTPTYETAQDWFDVIQSAGIISGFELDNSRNALELDVLLGTGIIKIIDSEVGGGVSFDFAGVQNVTLTADNINYVYLDYNAGTPQVLATTNHSTIELNRHFDLGLVYKNGTSLKILSAGVHIPNLARTEHERLIERDGFTHISGAILSETGTLNLYLTGGKWFYGHNPVPTSLLDTSVADTFRYTHYGISSWIIDNATATAVDTTHYNDGTDTLALLTVNAYGTQWVYLSAVSELYVIYGTENGTLSDAQAATPPTSIPTYMATMGELVAKIIHRQDGTITEIQIVHDIQFTAAGVPNHNDTGNLNAGDFIHLTVAEKTKFDGIEALADVTDAVNIASSIVGVAGKTTFIDADTIPIIDSEDSNSLKELTGTDLKVYLKAYNDTLYAPVLGGDDNYVTDAEKAALHAAGSDDTFTVADESIDTTCFPLFVTAATGDVGPKTASGLTFNSSTDVLSATGFSGPLTGNVTGSCSGSAATVTGAAQTAITSVGTLTALQVDNININLNTISSTSGNLNITPVGGSSIVLDGAINIDAGVVTGATSITSTTFVGALTGQASTVATITGLAPDTATTQATQASITTCANLTTVGALNAGTITSAFGSINNGSSAITTTGNISGGLLNITTDIVLTEAADHTSTPGAGFGYLWVKNTTPSTLIFTDDAGTDITLGSGGTVKSLIQLTPSSAFLPVTNPAFYNSASGATTKAGWEYTAFDDSAQESMMHRVEMLDYDGGNITVGASIKLTAPPKTSKTVIFDLYTIGIASGENFENAVTVDTTNSITFTITRTELMPNIEDRDFSSASAWANVDINAYNETGDLTITANAADQYCTCPVASMPTTVGSRYTLEFDVANIVTTWTIKSFDGTQTIGTVVSNGTAKTISFIAETSGGVRIVADTATSSGDFDNFSLYSADLVFKATATIDPANVAIDDTMVLEWKRDVGTDTLVGDARWISGWIEFTRP